MKPESVNILGVKYTIEYVDRPSEVDYHKRESLWGQVDYWTRTIRIYDNGRPLEDIWQTIWHEVLHSLAEALYIESLQGQENESKVDILATAISDTLFRNGWVKV